MKVTFVLVVNVFAVTVYFRSGAESFPREAHPEPSRADGAARALKSNSSQGGVNHGEV
jgi:hypothetical protein